MTGMWLAENPNSTQNGRLAQAAHNIRDRRVPSRRRELLSLQQQQQQCVLTHHAAQGALRRCLSTKG